MMIPFLLMVGACNNLEPQVEVPKVISIKDVSKEDYVLVNKFQTKGLTLGFDSEGRVFGYSGLNRYFGKVVIDGDNIKIDPLATTRMAGSEEEFITENVYLTLLMSMNKIDLQGDKLILTNEKGETLEFLPKFFQK